MISIQNDLLSVSVRKTTAEICSIISLKTSCEYLWQGDPAYWSGQAPVLFPIVGALKDKLFSFGGKVYSLPQHGFARTCNGFEVSELTDSQVCLLLVSNEALRKQFPFDFELRITFTVGGSTLTILHEVRNTGSSTMYFSLGAHPAFRCPIDINEVYEDYYIDFGQPETDVTWQIAPDGLIGRESRSLLNNQQTLPLHHGIFDQGALIFKRLKTRTVALASRKSGRRVEVSFADFPYLGLWAKPGATFVCIEPWQGIADSVDADGRLDQKEGIVALSAGSASVMSYSIKIC